DEELLPDLAKREMRREEWQEPQLRGGQTRTPRACKLRHRLDLVLQRSRLIGEDPEVRIVTQQLVDLVQQRARRARVAECEVRARQLDPGLQREPREDGARHER